MLLQKVFLLSNHFHVLKNERIHLAVINFYDGYEVDLNHINSNNDSSYDVSMEEEKKKRHREDISF